MDFHLASCSPSNRAWNGGLEIFSEDYLRVVKSALADEASLDIRRRPVVFGYVTGLLAGAREWSKTLVALLEEDHWRMESTLKANPGGSARATEARYLAIRTFYHLFVDRWIALYPSYLQFSGVPAKPNS